MSIQAVLLPMFVLITLTFVLMVWMAYLRTSAIRSRAVRMGDIALREPNWPPRAMQIANAFHNQLELPVLFYVLSILAWMTKHADFLFIVMAWVFVLLRVVHAFVHVTDNDLRRRGPVFMVSAVVLALMWAIFMVRIVLYLP